VCPFDWERSIRECMIGTLKRELRAHWAHVRRELCAFCECVGRGGPGAYNGGLARENDAAGAP